MIGIGCGSLVALFFVIGVIAVATSDPDATSEAEVAPATDSSAAAKPGKASQQRSPQPEPEPEPEPQGPKTSFAGDGLYIVGTDIEPGTYRGNKSGGNCYWARLSGLGGEMDDTITNDMAQGPTVVTIKETDKGFKTQRCGQWTLVE